MSKMDHIGSHFPAKIDVKIDAKIEAGKVMENDDKTQRKLLKVQSEFR